jgi:hypothetical protein
MSGKSTLFISGAAIAAALALAGPANAGSTRDVLKGAAIGAGGGAVVGAVVPGLSVGEGALIGGAGGAVIGALDKDGRRWYRDSEGRKYWVDKRGRRHYRR